MEMKPIAENAIAEPAGIVPSVLLRPILTVPRNNAPADPPLYAYVCPHTAAVQLITEAITILPTVVEAKVVKPVDPLAGLFERRRPKRPGRPDNEQASNSEPAHIVRATVLLRFGEEIFVGAQLVRGHPDQLPAALAAVLARHAGHDLAHGQRHKWLASPPVPLPDGRPGV
jgi:hypothetical protein